MSGFFFLLSSSFFFFLLSSSSFFLSSFFLEYDVAEERHRLSTFLAARVSYELGLIAS